MKKLYSLLQQIYIEILRVSDHSWRRITGQPRSKSSLITPQLYLGGQYKKHGLGKLKAWNVTGIVSMRTAAAPPWMKDFTNFEFLQLPTPDQNAPLLSDLQLGVQFIKKHTDTKGSVYIHCHHGEGRGPTMAAAYLISQGMTTDDALNSIRRVRKFIRPTLSQIERLREYEKTIEIKN